MPPSLPDYRLFRGCANLEGIKLKFSRNLCAAFVAAAIPVAAMLSVAPASAATISHSVGFNINSETRGNDPALDFEAAIPFFDPTLGTLRQVDLRYSFDLNLVISIANRTVDPLPVTIDANNLLIEGPKFFDRFVFDNILASTSFGGTVIDVPAGTPRQIGSISLVLPGSGREEVNITNTRFRTSRPLVIRDIVLRPQGNVSPFIGTGDKILDFLASVSLPLDLPNFGNFLNGVQSVTNWTLDGSVDVTYDYEPAPAPVPLPAALPLLIGGLAVLGLVGRRRKQAAT